MFKSGFLPYGWSFIQEDDIEAVRESLHEEIITTGPTVGAFEKLFAETVGSKFAVSCNSGTAALHLAAMGIGLTAGDWVIVPAMTFVATANAARYMEAHVLFADVDPYTGLMTPETLRDAIKGAGDKRLKAVFVVHMNGHVADMGGIEKVAREHGLRIIEDSCHAVASIYAAKNAEGRLEEFPVGACAHSDMSAFSFHPVKTITTGEGGCVTFNDSRLYDHLVNLRTHGIVRDQANVVNPELGFDASGNLNPWYYEMQMLGHNFRLTDFQCALGIRQIQKLPQLAGRRRQIMAMYDARFAPYANVLKPVSRGADVNPCLHLYPLLIDFGAVGRSRAEVMTDLRGRKIGTQVHYIPVPSQPYYQGLYGKQEFPGTMSYYNRVLSIPFYPAMKDEHVDYVVRNICDVLGLA